MMNELVAKTKNVRDMLNKSRDQIKTALPRHMNADRMLRVAMTSIQKNPKLLDCDPRTLVGRVMECSQLGLEPDGILGHAYLLPFKNTRAGRMDCQLIVGYKGLIDLARRSGQVSSIYSRVVWDQEPFEFRMGLEPHLSHMPKPPGQRGTKRVGVYAVAKLKDGTTQFEFLYPEEIEQIKKSSKSAKNSDSPWQSFEDEMWKKTAVRRLAKSLPLSPEFQRAAELDEQIDLGIVESSIPTPEEEQPVSMSDTVEVEQDKPEPEQKQDDDQWDKAEAQAIAERIKTRLADHCNGDVEQMEAICKQITEFKGKTISLDELPEAKPGRL
jgi:recombination protein RecT